MLEGNIEDVMSLNSMKERTYTIEEIVHDLISYIENNFVIVNQPKICYHCQPSKPLKYVPKFCTFYFYV